MPRYVVLLHETPPSYPRGAHFDLMLEQEGVLWTWALEELPTTDRPVVGERLADHRLAYLDFEGELTGDRGSVKRVAGGEYELLEAAADRLAIRVAGGTVAGIWNLQALPGDTQRWRISLSLA